ncbi:putative PAN/Apple domain-containing protein [Septoria linicola]|nr:putative PAN/Apple domain-containing protein [Septoria linicola]
MYARCLVLAYALALFFDYASAQTNSFSCAANNNQVVTDATTGERYIMRCGVDSTPSGGPAIVNVNNFNQCFNECSTRANCAGFTYAGASQGQGVGQCYLKATSDTSKSGFAGGPSNTLVSAIKLANYPPLPPSYTCPLAQDRTVVTDPNTGVQYVLWCNYDTAGNSPWRVDVSDSFNDCFHSCSTSADRSSGNCTGFTYSGATNGAGSGSCYMKVVSPLYFIASAPNTPYAVAAVRLDAYDGRNGAPFFYATTVATVFPPAATQVVTRIDYLTSTLLAAFPVTALSTITRFTTLTSSLTLTLTKLLTLPDVTQQVTSIQIVPTTIITVQIATITISTVTTQQILTVIPTTIIQTLTNTFGLLSTGSSTRTTIVAPIVTVTPVQSVRQTVTITNA